MGTVGRVVVAASVLWLAVAAEAAKVIPLSNGFRAEGGRVAIECTRDLQLRVYLRNGGRWVTLSDSRDLPRAITVKLNSGELLAFQLTRQPSPAHDMATEFGPASRVSVTAADAAQRLRIDLAFDFPARYPDVVVQRVNFANLLDRPASSVEVQQIALRLAGPQQSTNPRFWSLQGGGYKWGADWVLPVRAGFAQDNDTGPKGDGNGGGIPLVDLWRPEMGMAVAVLDAKPVLARLPVTADREGSAEIRVVTKGAFAPPPLMIAVHRGDFYDSVVRYRELMDDLGVHVPAEYEPKDYAPAWCTWGFRRKFTMEGVLAKLDDMRRLGMSDFILDDGWFDKFGDWRPSREKFPLGEPEMKAAIARVHSAGLTFRLWWSPGSADPGSDVERDHADWFILDRSGKKAKASWDAYYLCPAYAPVREATLGLVRRFVQEWQVDAFKLDGTSLNHAPLCYNPAHRHARPEESFEKWPGLFLSIRDEARRLRPGFRIELCPCGITPTFQLAASMEQPTDSDPFDGQVTYRTKFLKAMFGPRAPVLQEYVGLSEPGSDADQPRMELYARAIGAGQVPSTFSRNLTAVHARWTELYNRHRPAEGEYLNLYDIRWEPVEGHAIRKGDKMYYGFFTQSPGATYSGTVELRGLAARRYRVTDYANERVIANVTGPVATVPADIHDSLLLVAEPL